MQIENGPFRYDGVGYCIYCGMFGSPDNKLTEEHVIPSGLAGTLVLPEASCERCNKLTTFFEERCLRGNLNPFRSVYGARGKRRKKKRPTALPVSFNDGAVSEDVSLSEYPVFVAMPKLDPPGFWLNRDRHPEQPDMWHWVAPDAQDKADLLMHERGWINCP